MSDKRHTRILDACLKLLRPIARALLAIGVSYREFDEISKRAFVETASEEFGVRGRMTNTSRVSAMTGIPRKEVQRIRQDSGLEDGESTKLLSPLADLLHVWATTNVYVDTEGLPKVLPMSSQDEASFEDLVKLCVGDVPAGAVRTELIRLGAVAITPHQELRMVRRSLIPPEVDARLESALLYSMRGLAETIAHNNDPRVLAKDRRFERYVESRPMSDEEIEKLRPIIKARMKIITEELDAMLNSGPIHVESADWQRVGVGLYFSE